MEKEMLFFLSIIIHMVQLICLGWLGSIFFRKRERTAGKFILFLCLLTLAQIWTADNYLIYSIAQQMLLILFFYMIFCGNHWEKLGLSAILAAVWEFTWNGINSILSICEIILSNNRFFPFERGSGYVISILSFSISTVFIYMLFYKTKLSEGNFLPEGGKILFPIASLLLLLINLCNFGITRGVAMVSDNGADYWNITHNELFTHMEVLTVSALCTVICLSLLFGMDRLIKYIAVDNLRKIEISRYKEILEQYRKQSDVRHDMKNHLISLSSLADQEEWDKLKEYLQKIYDEGIMNRSDIETGNSIVNAIINTKRQSAVQNGITFDCNINIPKPLRIDDYDLCIIWGNILDNAINAAGVTKYKYIFVQTEIIKKNLLINVKNSIAPDILQNGLERQNWGTGLKNVNRIVQRENGIMDIEINDTVFEISIMLPIVQESAHDIN